MKSKLLILFLFCWSATFGQSVPNTTTFSFFDVATAVYGDHNSGRNLVSAFADSDAAKFDPAYSGSKNSLLNFRNYGAASVPAVTTTAVTAITATTATSGGNVTSDGGGTVTDRGVCWNTSTDPTTANSNTHDGYGTGSYSSSLTSLSNNTTYYVRAYAINYAGTSYGANVTFIASDVTTGNGRMYNNYAASNANLPMSGWHIPTYSEITTLIAALGGSGVAGGAAKETGYTHWKTPNTGATNSSGLTWIASGYRDYSGNFWSNYLQCFLLFSDNGAIQIAYNSDDFSAGVGFTNRDGGSIVFIKDNSTLANYTDYEGTVYPAVKIGNQVWMKTYLKTTHLNNGTSIANITDNSSWASTTSPAWCWYNNNAGFE